MDKESQTDEEVQKETLCAITGVTEASLYHWYRMWAESRPVFGKPPSVT